MTSEDANPSVTQLRANAWCGNAAVGELGSQSLGWGARRDLWRPPTLLAPTPVNLADWQDERVGWGLIVPDREDVSAADKARGLDLPDSLRTLVKRRHDAPIFRYRAAQKEGRLRRYAFNGTPSDPSLRGKRGRQEDAVPHYLLIVGDPVHIPWGFQYRLQTEAFVGRLDLDEHGLERYVEALLSEWGDCDKDRTKPLVWAADHGHPDITRLMRMTIAETLATAFESDPGHEFKMTGGRRMGPEATHSQLREALGERNPAFVLTSSHGATFPLNDPASMRLQLGLPVDQDHTPMDLTALSAWDPYGAIWYAHACCSAGVDSPSRFVGLVEAGSTLAQTLEGISKIGACQAPLPSALLGGPRPARAFIGHVEPTFDWTLRDPITGQVTTQPIMNLLYGELHQASSPPVGLALSGYFRAVAGLLQDYAEAIEGINHHEHGAPALARRVKLTALDRLAMVVLGDPTVRLAK